MFEVLSENFPLSVVIGYLLMTKMTLIFESIEVCSLGVS